MAFTDLVSSFKDTLGTLQGVFSTSRSGPYPNIQGITNDIIPSNWKLTLPYSFKVVGASSPVLGAKSPISGLFNTIGGITGGGIFDEFILPLNPSEINQSEVFSITTTPTQRGIVSEHNGIIFKDLNISGTTGMRPEKDRPGMEIFLQLRNYFRAYAQIKKSPDQRNTRLLFINRKDNEQLIVEPVNLTMNRSKDAPFMYDYSISLRVLGLNQPAALGGILGGFFEKFDNIVNKVDNYIQKARYIFQACTQLITTVERDFVNTILQPIELIGLTFRSARKTSFTLADVPSNVLTQLSNRTVKAFLDEAKFLKKSGNRNFTNITIPNNTQKEAENNGYKALKVLPLEAKNDLSIIILTPDENKIFQEAIVEAKSKTKEFYEDYKSEILRVRDVSFEKFGIDMTDYNLLVGRENQLNNIDEDKQITNEERDFIDAFHSTERALDLILSTNVLFKDTIRDYIKFTENSYNGDLILDVPNSVDEIILQHDKTLEDIAAEFLGTAEKWIEIAIANNLIAPYIALNSTNPRIKKPGDKLLIPRISIPQSSIIPMSKEVLISENLTATERNLGVDLKVNKDFDFILDNNNDFRLVASGANAAQAIIIKLALEKGSLKYHPSIGVGLNIGQKIRNGLDVRDDIISTILSDTRFENIKDLSLSIEGSTIKINLGVIVKYLSEPLPVTFLV